MPEYQSSHRAEIVSTVGGKYVEDAGIVVNMRLDPSRPGEITSVFLNISSMERLREDIDSILSESKVINEPYTPPSGAEAKSPEDDGRARLRRRSQKPQ